uniref:SGNH_hydro domain-containing protein n=1 Tax=Syphacia muris TaxID=451379 RepID=A0A0N5B131_9BILA
LSSSYNFRYDNLQPHTVQCTTLTVFGDSLTDDGIEVGENANGFNRNSNGPVWAEYLNKLLGCEKYINYAHSGAKSDHDNVYFTGWSGILWQIETYLTTNPSVRSLIILQSGGVLDFLSGATEAEDQAKVIENIEKAIEKLSTVTDGTIIVMNIMDPSLAPGVRTMDQSEDLAEKLSHLVSTTNAKLWNSLYENVRDRPRIGLFDLNAAVLDSMKRMNKTTPFTHHRDQLTTRQVYSYAYHDLWNPSTFVHYNIALKLVNFLEDL